MKASNKKKIGTSQEYYNKTSFVVEERQKENATKCNDQKWRTSKKKKKWKENLLTSHLERYFPWYLESVNSNELWPFFHNPLTFGFPYTPPFFQYSTVGHVISYIKIFDSFEVCTILMEIGVKVLPMGIGINTQHQHLIHVIVGLD